MPSSGAASGGLSITLVVDVVRNSARLGQPSRLGGRKLAGVLTVGTIVNDRVHARLGERLDIGAGRADRSNMYGGL